MEYLHVRVLVVSLHSCCQPIYMLAAVCVCVLKMVHSRFFLRIKRNYIGRQDWSTPNNNKKKSRVEKGFSRTLAKYVPSFCLHANSCCSSNSNSSSSVRKTRVLLVRCYCCGVARSLRDANRLDNLEDCRSTHDKYEQCQQPGSNGVLFLSGLV